MSFELVDPRRADCVGIAAAPRTQSQDWKSAAARSSRQLPLRPQHRNCHWAQIGRRPVARAAHWLVTGGLRMMAPCLAALILAAAMLPSRAAEWQPIERVKPYPVAGTTGIELYRSIGANGPVIGGGRRTIAITNWDLKWRRDYRPTGSACVLKSALPFLTITYSLPKPSAKLSGSTERHWKNFIDGIAAHEKVHGRDIIAMTEEIILNTVGLRIENDAGCKLIRAEVLKRVQAAADHYKAKARAFDGIEMSNGGNVQQLILNLVNGQEVP